MTHEQVCAAGCGIEPLVYQRLKRFVALLLEENARLNLTGIRTAAGAWPLHICDSLAVLPVLGEHGAERVIDLGTGGGVPGVPLACAAPDNRFTLIDATRKKIDAVRRIVAGLDLSNVECVWARAETLAREATYRDCGDVVVARAVAKIPDLVAYSAGLLRPGGIAVFMKSVEAADAEVAEAGKAARRGGLEWVETRQYELPAPHGCRCLVLYRKRQR